MKKIILIFSLYLITFIASPFVKSDLAFAKEQASASSAKIQIPKEGTVIDYRVKVLGDYLKKYNSPLTPYAETFVRYADQYNLDWRLVASISGIESTFGHQIPYGTYNGWGWGIYGTNMIWFTSWEDGIRTVSQGLRENYINKWGATNVYQIGKFYAASPTWAQKVDYFMRNMEDFRLRSPQSTLLLSI